jgi:hypothetical protein
MIKNILARKSVVAFSWGLELIAKEQNRAL